VADIHAKNAGGARLQQAIGKAPCRLADIQAAQIPNVEARALERPCELEPASRNIAVGWVWNDGEFAWVRCQRRGALDRHPRQQHPSGVDQALGGAARLGQTLRDKYRIDAQVVVDRRLADVRLVARVGGPAFAGVEGFHGRAESSLIAVRFDP